MNTHTNINIYIYNWTYIKIEQFILSYTSIDNMALPRPRRDIKYNEQTSSAVQSWNVEKQKFPEEIYAGSLSSLILLNETSNKWDHSVYAPSHCVMALHCNAIFHWLSAYTEWYLNTVYNWSWYHSTICLSWKQNPMWSEINRVHSTGIESRQLYPTANITWITACDD